MGCASSKKNNSSPTHSEYPSKENFLSKYSLKEEIGSGAFSAVRLAVSKATGERYAVKCIKRKDLPKEDEVSLMEEVSILKRLDHPNIIKLYEFFQEHDYYYLVTELMEGGELFDRIVQKTFYNEKEARDLVRILLDTICFCHENGIVHRDLKPENLLLKTKFDDSQIKLADFGFAKECEGAHSLSTQCGTPGYVAPEILKGLTHGVAVDMWSIGVITFILLGGYPPFVDENQANLYRKIKHGEYKFDEEYWDPVSIDAKDLISKLLIVDPEKKING